MADMVSVRVDDLRLLLQRAEPLLVSPERRDDPVVNAIDRLGDACLVARRSTSCPRCGAGPKRPECYAEVCTPDGLTIEPVCPECGSRKADELWCGLYRCRSCRHLWPV